MVNYITEAEYITDVGDEYYELINTERARDDIKEDRRLRLQRLAGKYILMTNGKSSNKQCYLQDQRISVKGYWTQFLSNAYSFNTKYAAETELKKLKYGNPRIGIVTSDFNIQTIR